LPATCCPSGLLFGAGWELGGRALSSTIRTISGMVAQASGVLASRYTAPRAPLPINTGAPGAIAATAATAAPTSTTGAPYAPATSVGDATGAGGEEERTGGTGRSMMMPREDLSPTFSGGSM
jgi:hypothetical protein